MNNLINIFWPFLIALSDANVVYHALIVDCHRIMMSSEIRLGPTVMTGLPLSALPSGSISG